MARGCVRDAQLFYYKHYCRQGDTEQVYRLARKKKNIAVEEYMPPKIGKTSTTLRQWKRMEKSSGATTSCVECNDGPSIQLTLVEAEAELRNNINASTGIPEMNQVELGESSKQNVLTSIELLGAVSNKKLLARPDVDQVEYFQVEDITNNEEDLFMDCMELGQVILGRCHGVMVTLMWLLTLLEKGPTWSSLRRRRTRHSVY